MRRRPVRRRVGASRVANLDAAVKRADELDDAILPPAQDVGEGIRVATIGDPAGNLVGLIENPHFQLP